MTVVPLAALLALIGIRGWTAWDDVVMDDDVPPRLLSGPRPTPPEDVPGVGRAGIAELELAIGPDGRVDTVTLVRSVPVPDGAVLRAVCAWRFAPAQRRGVSVRAIGRAWLAVHGGVGLRDFGAPIGGVVGSGLGALGTEGEPVACPR
jgi:TonB family protein